MSTNAGTTPGVDRILSIMQGDKPADEKPDANKNPSADNRQGRTIRDIVKESVASESPAPAATRITGEDSEQVLAQVAERNDVDLSTIQAPTNDNPGRSIFDICLPDAAADDSEQVLAQVAERYGVDLTNAPDKPQSLSDMTLAEIIRAGENPTMQSTVTLDGRRALAFASCYSLSVSRPGSKQYDDAYRELAVMANDTTLPESVRTYAKASIADGKAPPDPAPRTIPPVPETAAVRLGEVYAHCVNLATIHNPTKRAEALDWLRAIADDKNEPINARNMARSQLNLPAVLEKPKPSAKPATVDPARRKELEDYLSIAVPNENTRGLILNICDSTSEV